MISNFLLRLRLIRKENPENEYYGHNLILRNYAKVKLPYIIPGYLQHGWRPDCGICGDLSQHTEKEKSLRYFVWNSRNLEKAIDYGYKNVTPIGAPFVYLPPRKKINVNPKGPKSLLIFPLHSTDFEPFIDPLRVYKKYLKELNKIIPLFKPISVCLYWYEYQNKKVRKLFEKENMEVVTLGHREKNPDFLINFRNLVDQYPYVSSNMYSSAVFYSLYMGKKVFILGKPEYQDIKLLKWKKRRIYDHDEFSSLYPELLWKNFDDKSYSWIGEKELGLEFKRSPRELLEIFGWTPRNFVKRNLYELIKKIKRRIIG